MALSNFVAREPRPLPIFIMADTSGSMSGDKIDELNLALREMVSTLNNIDDIRGKFQLAIVAFGGENVTIVQPLTDVEEIELEEREPYTEKDREFAVQDWWDAWRNAVNGNDTWDEESSAFEYFQEVFGDDFADVFYNINERLNEMEDRVKMEDIPEDWWRTTGSWGDAGGVTGENGVTSKDLEGLNSIPAGVETASERGVRKGIAGLRVEIDGQAAGRILAPYVSREIAREIV